MNSERTDFVSQNYLSGARRKVILFRGPFFRSRSWAGKVGLARRVRVGTCAHRLLPQTHPQSSESLPRIKLWQKSNFSHKLVKGINNTYLSAASDHFELPSPKNCIDSRLQSRENLEPSLLICLLTAPELLFLKNFV